MYSHIWVSFHWNLQPKLYEWRMTYKQHQFKMRFNNRLQGFPSHLSAEVREGENHKHTSFMEKKQQKTFLLPPGTGWDPQLMNDFPPQHTEILRPDNFFIFTFKNENRVINYFLAHHRPSVCQKENFCWSNYNKLVLYLFTQQTSGLVLDSGKRI